MNTYRYDESDDGYDTANKDEYINENKEIYSNRCILRKHFRKYQDYERLLMIEIYIIV